MVPTPVFLPGEVHGQRILAEYSPWGPKELDTTEQLTLHSFLNMAVPDLGGFFCLFVFNNSLFSNVCFCVILAS